MKASGQEVLKVQCKPAEPSGKRRVFAAYGSRTHTDVFDVDSAFHRQKWREAAKRTLKISGAWSADGGENDSAVHEELERQLLDAVDAADSQPQGLWTPSVQSIADIDSQHTEWLWEQHIPRSALTVLDGDPGVGKSQLTIDLAARVTRGDSMPPGNAGNGTVTPRGVLLSNAEDDPARTLKPRLQAAGAVLDRVHCLRSMAATDGEEERPVSLPEDLAAIELTIRERDVALWVVDPWAAFLSSELNMNADADVRRCLGQCAAVAERTGCAVVFVRHLNKKSGLAAIYRGGGSIGITGAARAAFMVGVDPGDAAGRILAPVKCNLAPEPPSMRFTIEPHGSTSRVRWNGECEVSAHDVLDAKQRPKGGKLDEAKGILRDLLARGRRGSNEVEGAMHEAGVSDATYRRARRELGVLSERSGFNDGQWLLELPAEGGEEW